MNYLIKMVDNSCEDVEKLIVCETANPRSGLYLIIY
jgi:hypothetical protein